MSLLDQRDRDACPSGGRLIGVDEAGRGALAGPVVVAAVILDCSAPIEGINDSKLLSPKKRESLYIRIVDECVAWKVVEIPVDVIDRENILRATLRGMSLAASELARPGDLCLIDGNSAPGPLPCALRCVVDGDAMHACIAAASILAKVHRDRLMVALDAAYPDYGFARHKGYGTPQHLQALRDKGPCPLHRLSFAPVAQTRIIF